MAMRIYQVTVSIMPLSGTEQHYTYALNSSSVGVAIRNAVECALRTHRHTGTGVKQVTVSAQPQRTPKPQSVPAQS